MRLTRRKLAAAVAATPTVAALLTGRASAAEVHEVTLGDAKAPVTIIEYFSLTCRTARTSPPTPCPSSRSSTSTRARSSWCCATSRSIRSPSRRR